MPLTVGSRLGHYDVTALIGEGGMGQVYQATDTKLGRQVALKILPEAFAADPDRLARFQREAQVLASLNHPGIAAIYGIEESEGTRALVLELVEGPTLADRIAQGPISVDEALPIAKQIAEALETAHEAGVIHRDLKPANIKVREDGTVKVLDFGLAKALDTTPEGDPAQSPTLTAAATQMGMIMGTAAYMSPEQARGKPVDERADIWGFGCVLFEMLTGHRVFEGEDVSVTLADVIRADPAWSLLPDGIPVSLGTYLKRCLEKRPTERIQAIGDVRLALDGAFETPVPEAVAESQPRGRRQTTLLAGSMLAVGSLISGLAVWSVVRPEPALVTRFTMTLPTSPLPALGPKLVAISPNGRTLVYSGADQLYRRDMAQLGWQPIPSTDAAFDPLFSPDGQWLAFEDSEGLKRVPMGGGPPATIVAGVIRGATWGDDGSIVFAHAGSGLSRVAAAGGVEEAVTTLGEGEIQHQPSDTLPGSQAVLFTNRTTTDQVAVVSLESGDRHDLFPGNTARYVSTGHIVFVRDGAVWAVPFDAGALEVTGAAVPILEGVRIEGNSGYPQLGVGNDGSLAYLPDNTRGGQARSSLVWFDHMGQQEAIPLPPDDYFNARLSPDDTQLSLWR